MRALRIVDLRQLRAVDEPLNALHEQVHLRQFLQLLEVDCVFDVGANRGQYAFTLRKKAGFNGRIISFEPIPELASAICHQSERDPLWTVEEIAGGETGIREFHIMQEPHFSSLAIPRHRDVSILNT